MAAIKCIMGKAAAGLVNQDRAQAASDLYDEQLAELARRNVPNAATMAEQRTLDALRFQKLASKKATIAQLRAQEGIRARLQGTRQEAGGAAMALLDFDPAGKHVGASVVQTGKTIENEAFSLMEGTLRKFRVRFANADKLPTAAREARRASMRQVVRELFGEESGSAEAKTMAEGISGAFDYLRKLWNASGGSIGEIDRWGMPQTHNARLLAAINEPGLAALAPAARAARKADIWADYVTPLLDRQRMTDFSTGQPISDPTLRNLLRDTYKSIVTGGLSDETPGTVSRNGGFTGRRQQARFLVYKDADSWMDYQSRFGNASPFDSVIQHIRSFSRDVSTLRILGPAPEASIQYAERLIASEQGDAAMEGVGDMAARLAGNKFSKAARFRNLWSMVSGGLSAASNSTAAILDETNRNVLQSALIAGAALSAVSDRAFTWASASLLGLPNGKILARFIKELNPLSTSDQSLAARLGFGADAFMGSMISANRYTGEVFNPSISRTLTDSILRASGLVRLTDAGRTAFQIEFLSHLTGLRDVAFGDLPEATARGFALHGINKSDWDLLRQTPLWRDEKSGAQFLRPGDLVGNPKNLEPGPLFDRRFDVATKFTQLIDTEKDFAIPSSSVRARSDMLMGSRPGAVGGIFLRNAALLKSFPLTLMYYHANRVLNADLPRLTRGKMAAQIILGSTVLGALSVQLKNIAAGRDPQNMEDARFWLKAASTGGGAGIFGDLVFGDMSRIGSLSDYMLGPALTEELPQVYDLTFGTAKQLVTTGTTKGRGKALVDFARLMQPGRSLWYLALAQDRLIYDTLQQQLNPDYGESFRRAEQNAMRDYGQEFFAPPGQGFPPQRAPDLSQALP